MALLPVARATGRANMCVLHYPLWWVMASGTGHRRIWGSRNGASDPRDCALYAGREPKQMCLIKLIIVVDRSAALRLRATSHQATYTDLRPR